MEKIISAVDRHRALILDAERYIWNNPETGYKEFKTTAYLAERFEGLGYRLTYAEGITGFTAELDTGRDGPTLLILGELDSVICRNHPECDKETGAVHSCGHNVQCAALLGIAAALKEDGVTDGLSGKIRLCAVPAEELLEVEFRSKLKAEGKIKYYGGKGEFLHRGLFDGVDLAFMVHASAAAHVDIGHNGCMAKNVIYKGKASHAGGAPWNGVNALYAASCGLNAVNAIRETFKEADAIRVHPIVTDGGSMVNAIPETVKLESYVRGSSFDAIVDANKKVNRALIGAALSIGANVEIIDVPGYAPETNCPDMTDVAIEAYKTAFGGEELKRGNTRKSSSTDMGDLSSVMPTVQSYIGGVKGTSHGADYYVIDPETACVKNAKWQLTMIKLLLSDGAARARRIISDFKPLFESKEAYLSYVDRLNASGDRIIYNKEDGTARVTL